MKCSDAARARGEALAGTAPTAKRWLMIELPTAWAAEPLDSAPLTDQVREALDHAARRWEATVLLVRRPGRGTRPSVRRWWAVDVVTKRQVSGQWAAAEDLVDGDVDRSEVKEPSGG